MILLANRYLAMTTDIVVGYIKGNAINGKDIPDLIASVHSALTNAATVDDQEKTVAVPAVPIKNSVFPDYIVCLEDGKRLKMLKRHLSTSFGMTPEQYRARWHLPVGYPMTAPNYSKRRSGLAKEIKLGRKPGFKPGLKHAA